jgi:hypothetical protein
MIELVGGEGLVGVEGAAGEAPELDLVDHVDLSLGVPGLGRDVDPVHRDEVVGGGAAGLARALICCFDRLGIPRLGHGVEAIAQVAS